jgi:SAM-dependent methyltransferase
MSLTRLAHQLISEHIAKLKIQLAIDGTCGNGHDTAFLAKISDHVIGFDVQKSAIENTANRLQELALEAKVTLLHKSHEDLKTVLDELVGNQEIGLAMFNFGYLPKSDDLTIVTLAKSSVSAVKQVIKNLSANGYVSLLCYRGHNGGKEEYQAIEDFLNSLNSQNTTSYQIDRYVSKNSNSDKGDSKFENKDKGDDTTPVLITIKVSN